MLVDSFICGVEVGGHTSSSVSRTAQASILSPTSLRPRGRNQRQFSRGVPGRVREVSWIIRTLQAEGWNVAVPAARTKLLEGQWVLGGGVNVVGSDMMQAEVFRCACNVL